MPTPRLLLTLRAAPPDSALSAGLTWRLPAGEHVLGRAADASVPIGDATVSRRHLLLDVREDGTARLRPLTTRNGSFLDGAPLSEGWTDLPAPRSTLQLGGVLVDVFVEGDTRPNLTPLTLPARAPTAAGPFLQVRWDVDRCTVRCQDRALPLPSSEAAVLSALCRSPGQPVHFWDIHEEVGSSCNVAQKVTGIRQALARLIETGQLSRTAVVARIEKHRAGEAVPDTLPVSELMRLFIGNRRGHGYFICLDASEVEIERV